MRNVGFIASGVGHILLLGLGVFSLPSANTHDKSELEILPIELVSVADVTDVRKGEKTAKPKEKLQEATKKKPEPKKPEPKKEPPKPKKAPPKKEAPKSAPPKSDPVPKPEKSKPEPKKPEPKPEPVPEKAKPAPKAPKPIAAVPKVKPKPPKKKPAPKKPKKKQPPKKKRTFDANALKALVNKADSASELQSATDDQQASLGSRSGKQAAAMTQSELDALRAQVAACWSPPTGAADASQLRVRIQFGLDRQGNVTSGPEPFEFPASKFGVAAVESAMRAVRRCAPYDLPAEKYDAWRQVRITFDPRDMF